MWQKKALNWHDKKWRKKSIYGLCNFHIIEHRSVNELLSTEIHSAFKKET